jgi:hypothetical protein
MNTMGVLPRNRRRQRPSQSIIHIHSVIGDTWVTWKIICFYNVLVCDQATESQPGYTLRQMAVIPANYLWLYSTQEVPMFRLALQRSTLPIKYITCLMKYL